jgi:hypothetical protein
MHRKRHSSDNFDQLLYIIRKIIVTYLYPFEATLAWENDAVPVKALKRIGKNSKI